MGNDLFGLFEGGALRLPGKTAEFAGIPWVRHPDFAGVEMKHIVTAEDTGGAVSLHLVRVAPGKAIGSHAHKAQLEIHEVISGSGECVHGGAEVRYEAGVVSVIRQGAPHEVRAGKDGLFLLAKFIPALR